MTVNDYRPHVFVLPEDDANRQLARGFDLNLSTRQFQVLPEAEGWTDVCDCFVSDHAAAMRKYNFRFMILLVDFDDNLNRLDRVKSVIPENLIDRVFVLGALSTPEALRKALGSYEKIGDMLAEDCRNGTQNVWAHELLRHNEAELIGLRQAVCSFLFRTPPGAEC